MNVTTLAANCMPLAEIYEYALDCFDWIQFGLIFRSRVQNHVLKLDIARLRLSRWGQAVGLSSELGGILTTTPLAEEGQLAAETFLKLFLEKTPGFQWKYNSPKVLSLDEEMDPIGRSLHERIGGIVTKRKSNTHKRKKSQINLVTGEDFDLFLEMSMNLADELLSLVQTRQLLKELCKQEIISIGKTEHICMLWGVSASQDQDLEEEISNCLKCNVASVANTSVINNYGGKQVVTVNLNYGYQKNAFHYTF